MLTVDGTGNGLDKGQSGVDNEAHGINETVEEAWRNFLFELSESNRIPVYIVKKIKDQLGLKDNKPDLIQDSSINETFQTEYKEEMLAEVTKRFISYFYSLITSLENERQFQGEKHLSDKDQIIFATQFLYHLYNYYGYLRKDNLTSYSEGHVIPVMRILIEEMGVTHLDSILAALHHDDYEDLRDEQGKVPEIMCIPTNEKIAISRRRKLIRNSVIKLVEGITNIEADSKDETKAKTLQKILKHLLEGVHILFIKLADRLDNLRTIDNLSEESKERMLKETVNVYLPLAHNLGVANIRDKIMELCMMHINPSVYSRFQEESEILGKQLANYKSELGTIFQYSEQDEDLPITKIEETSLADLIFKYLSKPENSMDTDFFEVLQSVRYRDLEGLHGKLVVIVESASGFKRNMRRGIELKLIFDTLNLSQEEREIYLICIKQNKPFNIWDIRRDANGLGSSVSDCLRKLTEYGLLICDKSDEQTYREYVLVNPKEFIDSQGNCTLEPIESRRIDSWLLKSVEYIDAKKHQSIFLQRRRNRRKKVEIEMMTQEIANDKKLDAKQGILKTSKSGKITKDMREAIQRILDNISQWGDVYGLAGEELFQPPVRVYTPGEEEKRLPRSATYLDYARDIHTHFMLGIQSLVVDGRRRSFKHIFDLLEDDEQIKIISCIPPNSRITELPDDIMQQIKFSPSWFYFAGMETTRKKLMALSKKVYSEKEEHLDLIIINYITQLIDLFGEEIIEKVYKCLLEEVAIGKYDFMNKSGFKKSLVQGLNQEQKDNVETELKKRIVFGEIDLVEKIAENKRKWLKLEVKIPNKKGELEKLSKRLGLINIDGIVFAGSNSTETPDRSKTGSFEILLPDDPRRKKFYYVTLLKVKLHYPSLKIVETEQY